jgi:hypothetical protein
MGQYATALLADIKAKMKQQKIRDTPFDLATAIVNELQSSRFEYSTNIPGVCDHDSSTVECFAHQKIGFCEHFASTMAILLRHEGIPSRLVEGFLPGSLDVATGKETITTGAAHAWVEVYFPNIGWYRFDPTGGDRSVPEAIPVGAPQPIPTTKPLPSLNLPSGAGRDGADPLGSRRPAGAGTTGRNGSSNAGPFVAIGIVLVALVVLIGFLAYRRGPRGATTPDGVYASVAALARRFGFGPRPTQTAFEYATALGDVLPGVRPELQTVATAKVEVSYGRRELGDDRIKALRDSYRRLRVGLLRLAFRRGDRPKKR